MNCTQCIEIENFLNQEIIYLKREIQKRDEVLQDQEYEIQRLRHIVEWFYKYINSPR